MCAGEVAADPVNCRRCTEGEVTRCDEGVAGGVRAGKSPPLLPPPLPPLLLPPLLPLLPFLIPSCDLRRRGLVGDSAVDGADNAPSALFPRRTDVGDCDVAAAVEVVALRVLCEVDSVNGVGVVGAVRGMILGRAFSTFRA